MSPQADARADIEQGLGLFPYGLMIAASMDGETPVAIVVTWAMQVSFDPPLVAAAIERSSRLRKAIEASGAFTLSFLPKATGTALAKKFLQPSRMTNPAEMPLKFSPSRIPHVDGAIAWLDCRVRQHISTGDHDTVIGEVVESGGDPGGGEALSLKDTGWRYRR